MDPSVTGQAFIFGSFFVSKQVDALHAGAREDRAQPADEAVYLFGHSQDESGCLIDQAAILRPTIQRLLRRAGIEQGMRVLEVGCGTGDVSMLAGGLVGHSGSVVGIDPDPQTIAVARARAQADPLARVTFTEASAATFSDPAPFDFVVARYILVYQVDPVAFLRTVARFLRPGGILALHESVLDRPLNCRPRVALRERASEWLLKPLRRDAPSLDVAERLIEHFARAGLPPPTLFSETAVGGGVEIPHYAWLARMARNPPAPDDRDGGRD